MIRFVIATTSALSVVATVVLAQGAVSPAIKERQQLMKGQGAAFKEPAAMFKGDAPFDLAKVQASLKSLQESAKKGPSLFPDDSKTGGDTAALPAIWEKKADFEAIFAKLGADAASAAATVKDEPTFKAEWPKVVEYYGWLKPGEMLDGLGMAETTPGPLIMVLQFVGFMAAFRDPGGLSPMLAGTLGGLLATWVTFTPCFLWIFLGAPFVETLRGNKALSAALSAITAAVVGVVLNLAIWFAIHTVFRETLPIRAFPLSFDAPSLASVDVWALVLSLAAAVAIFRFKAGMIQTLAACCVAGIALYLAGAIG